MAEKTGEVLNIEEPESDVTDTDDGGAIIRLDDQRAQVDDEKEFYRNLADELQTPELQMLVQHLLDKVEYDKESRKKRDEQYAEGLKRTGLGDDAPGGAKFQGASRVTHPLLTEACIDFSSRAIRELFPADGPVRDYIPGTPTQARVDKAKRKTRYMNWQCKVQMPEFRSELEQLFTQNSLAGVGYLRVVYDGRKKRPVPSFVPVDDVYLPFAASSFYTAERITYVEYITQQEFEYRVREGIYRNVDNAPPAMEPDTTKAEKANQKIEGKVQSAYNEDGLRAMYEVMVTAELEADYGFAPYRITLDPNTKNVVAVIRNWEQDDKNLQPMFWMSEWPFVPWRGAYPIGFTQMIGPLSAAATGALRALLDTAHINNLPTLLKLKGTNFSGQSLELNVTQITEVEGAIATDDIRKLMMPLPFNQPSPVLFSLLGFLVDAGTGVVKTTFENLAENANKDLPVGTTMALIEQGMKVFSAIHARLHEAMARTLDILHRINRMYLTDEEVLEETGELIVKRTDFQGPLDVIPVSDPEIFSDVQRFAQMQVVAQRAAMSPLYDQRKVELMILEQTRIPDPESLLLPSPKPEQMNQVNENLAMTLGRPVAAFPDQDHLAHIQVLLDYMQSPVLGSSLVIAPTFMPAALQHLKEHLTLWYVSHVYEFVSGAMGAELGDAMKHRDPQTRAELDRTLAAASSQAIQQAGRTFGAVPPIIQKAMQLLEQIQPQPPDPKVQADMAKIASQEKIAQQKIQASMQGSQQRTQAEAQIAQFRSRSDMEREQMRQTAENERLRQREQGQMARTGVQQQAENARKAQELQTRERINTQDNQTALTIAEAETLSQEHVDVETGTGINPNPSN